MISKDSPTIQTAISATKSMNNSQWRKLPSLRSNLDRKPQTCATIFVRRSPIAKAI
jgi:hypothetical protein